MADQSDPINFEEMINDDILHVVFSYLSIKEIQPMISVNKRWKAVCLDHLKGRTRFDDSSLLLDRHLQGIQQKSKHFEKIKRMLVLMPGLKSLKISFYPLNGKDRTNLIEMIAKFKFLEELDVRWANKRILKKIIVKIGSKIKIFCTSYDPRFGLCRKLVSNQGLDCSSRTMIVLKI